MQDQRGDELAPTVRYLFPATPILFYSSAKDEDRLRSLIAARKVEGVFCSHRDRFIDRAGDLIGQFSSSLNRLSGMRGLAMRVVAECDGILTEAIRFMIGHENKCAGMMEKLDSDVRQSLTKRREKYEAAAGANDLDARLETRAIDSSRLYRHFREQSRIVIRNSEAFGLSPEQAERIRELRGMTSGYEQKVLNIRNALAHALEREEPDGWGPRRGRNHPGAGLPQYPSGVYGAHP